MQAHIRSVAAVAAAFALAPFASAQQDHVSTDHQFVRWDELLGQGSKLQFYGYLRADSMYNDSRMNDPQIPGWVASEDPAAPGFTEENDDEMAIHARLTRLGMNFMGPAVDGIGDPKLTGNVEIDFYNIGLNDNDSRTAIRMRKAYLDLAWDAWSLRAGQDWDWISPLYPSVNHDLVMWGAGNTGDRRPQFTVRHRAPAAGGTFETAIGAGLSGAVSSDTVAGGLRSGENSGLPMVAARAGWSKKGAQGGKWQFGVWGHWSEDEYDPTGLGVDDYASSSLGVDFAVPLIADSLWLQGEIWSGENMDDVRGGVFQGVNAMGEEIGATGGFLELGWKATGSATVFAGFSTDDPSNEDVNPNSPNDNQIAYVAVNWKFGVTRIGVEYLNWVTDFNGLEEGDANRIAAWIAYYF